MGDSQLITKKTNRANQKTNRTNRKTNPKTNRTNQKTNRTNRKTNRANQKTNRTNQKTLNQGTNYNCQPYHQKITTANQTIKECHNLKTISHSLSVSRIARNG